MTILICFAIAMVFIYVIRLFTGGFNITELLSFLLMIILLGSHVYLSTRRKAIYGIVIPIFIIASFYPVYKIMNPVGITFFVLIVLYMIALCSCIYIWYKARKSKN